ncbi:MAG: SMI1/KNR4 family protein [Candidatus Eremiobacterota bacterium]
MSTLIDRLDRALKKSRRKLHKALAPGATPRRLRKLERELNLELPATLRALLAWRNGFEPGADCEPWTGSFALMSADEIEKCALYHREQAGDWRTGGWDSGLLPFMAASLDDLLVVDLEGRFQGQPGPALPGQVVEFWGSDPDRPILYPSLEAWLEVLVVSLEEGAWKREVADMRKLTPIFRRICPGYPRPLALKEGRFSLRFRRINSFGQELERKYTAKQIRAHEQAEREARRARVLTPRGAAPPPGDPARTAALLQRLDAFWRKNRPAHYRTLRKPASPAALASLEEELGFSLPPTFKVLYGWKNGETGNCEERFQDNYSWMPLEDVAGAYDMLCDVLGEPALTASNWWNPLWVPFLENGAGDYLCLDLDGSFGGVQGQVLEFWHDEEWRDVRYPSLDAWLEVFVVSLEGGGWHLEDECGFFPRPRSKVFRESLAAVCPGYPKKRKARPVDDGS